MRRLTFNCWMVPALIAFGHPARADQPPRPAPRAAEAVSQLEAAETFFIEGRLRQATDALAGISLDQLENRRHWQYWRLRGEVSFESGRWADAVQAARECQDLFDELEWELVVDEVYPIASRSARSSWQLARPEDACRILTWGLERLDRAGREATSLDQSLPRSHQLRTSIARISLTGDLAAGYELAGVHDRSVLTHQTAVKLAHKWLDSIEDPPRCDERRRRVIGRLFESLSALGRRQEIADYLAAEGAGWTFPSLQDQILWQIQKAEQWASLENRSAASESLDRAQVILDQHRTSSDESVDRLHWPAELAYQRTQLDRHWNDRTALREHARTAMEQCQKLLPLVKDNRQQLTLAARLRDLTRDSGDIPAALKQAAVVARLYEQHFDRHVSRLVRSQTVLAELHMQSGDLPAAQRMAGELLAWWHSQPQPDPQEYSAVVLLRSQLEQIERGGGSSLDFLESEQTFWRQKLKANHPLRSRLELELAQQLGATGNYQKAQMAYEVLYEQMTGRDDMPAGNAWLQTAAMLPMLLLSWANTYESQGQLAPALAKCEEALDSGRRNNAPADDSLPLLLAVCRLRVAQVIAGGLPEAESAQAVEQAEQCIQQACTLANSNAAGTPTGQEFASLYFHRGMVRWVKNQDDLAAADWQEALAVAKKGNRTGMQARLLVQLAKCSRRAGNYSAADERLAEAIRLLNQLQILPSLHYVALCNRAQNLLDLRTADAGPSGVPAALTNATRQQAIALLQQAVGLIEKPRASATGTEMARAQYFGKYGVAYDLLIDLMLSGNDRSVGDELARDALYFVDRSRSRLLLDQICNGGNDFDAMLSQLDPDAAAVRHELLQRHEWIQRNLAAAFDRDHWQALNASQEPALSLSDERVEQLQRELQEAQQELVGWTARFQDLVRNQRGGASTLPVVDRTEWKQKIDQLLFPGHVVLVYHVGQAKSHLFALSATEQRYWILRQRQPSSQRMTNLSAAGLTAFVNSYRNTLANPATAQRLCSPAEIESVQKGAAHAAEVARQASLELSEIVLPKPCLEFLAAAKASLVTIIADGPLQQLPFETLLIESEEGPRFVLDAWPPIAYAPSLMTLSELCRPRAHTQNENDQPVVISLGGQNFDWAGLRPLSNTARECASIAGTFSKLKAGHVRLFNGPEATEANFRAALAAGSCAYLHLATHAEAGATADDGLSGRIYFERPGQGTEKTDDGLLYLADLSALPLASCELAVLSACSTASGPNVPLETAASFLRGFLVAGAKRVAATHWEVDDEATASLVVSFMAGVAAQAHQPSDANYASALRAAKRELRQKQPSPYYWGPLVLYGPGW